MRGVSRNFRLAASCSLFAASALSQSVTTSTISIPVCNPSTYNNNGLGEAGVYGGNATGGGQGGSSATTSAGTGLSSSTPLPNVVQTVDSVYGTYDFAGFYDIPASGAILSGASITSKFMTLAYCASYCQGTEFFAVFAGNQCSCGIAGPLGSQDNKAGGCNTGCTGNTAECCGWPRTGIVYNMVIANIVSTYSTTNSAGSVITATQTTQSPVVPPGVPTVYTTIDSAGHTITTTSTLSATSTMHLTSASLCPGSDGTTYSDSVGDIYQISCGVDYPGNNLIIVSLSTLQACFLACDNYAPNSGVSNGARCVAVSFGAGQCYLKYAISAVNPTAVGFGSGRLVNYTPNPAPSTVTRALDSPSTSGPMTGGSSIPAATPSPTPGSYNLPCPQANGSTYVDAENYSYNILCGVNYLGNTLITTQEDTFGDCLLDCDNYVANPSLANGAGCVAVAWLENTLGVNCILKYTITQIVYGATGYDCAKQVGYDIPASVTTTTQSASIAAGTASSASTGVVTSPSTKLSSAGPTSTATTLSCPASNGQVYIDSEGYYYTIACGVNYPGNDLVATQESSYAACLLDCDNYMPNQATAGGAACVAVTWTVQSNQCFLKYAITSIVYDTGYDSARHTNYNPAISSSSSVSSVASSNGGTTSALNGASITVAASNTPATTSKAGSITTSAGATMSNAPDYPCPTYNGQLFIDSEGYNYDVNCSYTYPGNDLITTVKTSFAACFLDCDNYVPSASVAGGAACVAVTWITTSNQCFLKYAITTISYNTGYDSARYANYIPPAASGVSATSANGGIGSTTMSSSSTSTGTNPPAYPCPAYNGQLFIDSQGYNYDVNCSYTYSGNDLLTTTETSFAACLLDCDNYVPSASVAGGAACIGVTWTTNSNQCFLKYAITTISYDTGYDSARYANYIPAAAGISSSSSSIVSPSSKAGSATGGTGSTSTASSSSTSTNTNPPAYPCPAYNGQLFIDSEGYNYDVNCSHTYPGNDLVTTIETTFAACLLDCDNYVSSASVAGGAGCVAVTWNTTSNQCFLKYTITTISYNTGYDSARYANYIPPAGAGVTASNSSTSSSISSATSTASTPAGNGATSSSTTAGSGTTSSSTTRTSTTGTAYPCPDYNGRNYVDSEGYYNNISCGASFPGNDLITTTETTLIACLLDCDNYVASQNTAGGANCVAVTWTVNSNQCLLKYAVTSIVYDTQYDSSHYANYNPVLGGSGGSSTSSSSSATTSPTTPTTTSDSGGSGTGTGSGSGAEPTDSSVPVCPAMNNTRYTDYAGTTYEIRCGLDINGTNVYAVHADHFDKCMDYCDILGGCAGITYLDQFSQTATNCYPYTSFLNYANNGNTSVWSGVPVNGTTAPNGITTGAISSAQLCPTYNQTNYVDPTSNKTYFVGCNQNIQGAGPPGGQALKAAVAPTLDGCMEYCSLYTGCVGADFTGFPGQPNAANCYPKFSTGVITYAIGTSFVNLTSTP